MFDPWQIIALLSQVFAHILPLRMIQFKKKKKKIYNNWDTFVLFIRDIILSYYPDSDVKHVINIMLESKTNSCFNTA